MKTPLLAVAAIASMSAYLFAAIAVLVRIDEEEERRVMGPAHPLGQPSRMVGILSDLRRG